ncbi:MAG: TRAP transporter substrate-binding protein DctP [Mailhella sp.]|nr:TRAP transporter substrate-binding protein DctP [Mailhella sp.]
MRTLATVALMACMSFLSIPAYADDAVELNFQSIYSDAQTQTAALMKPWCEKIKELSGGTLTVHHFPTGAIVEPSAAVDAVENGTLDMLTWYGGVFFEKYPVTGMFYMPFMVKSAHHGVAVLNAAYEAWPELKAEWNNKKVPLFWWTSAPFSIASIKSPITKPADLKGKRVLVLQASDTPFVEAWGGTPVFVAVGDAYVGLQRGMGEALFTATPYQKGLKILEIAKYLTIVPSTATTMVNVINKDAWDDLSPAQQKALQDASVGMGDKLADSLTQDMEAIKAAFIQKGGEVITLTPEARQEFYEGCLPIINTVFKGRYSKSYLGQNAEAWMKKARELSESIPDPDEK